MNRKKYSGKGLIENLQNIRPIPYQKLTADDLKKFLRTLTRHKRRDKLGRFTSNIKVVLYPIDYEKEL